MRRKKLPILMAQYPRMREDKQYRVHYFGAIFGLYCLYSVFWDIGPLFLGILEVQVELG